MLSNKGLLYTKWFLPTAETFAYPCKIKHQANNNAWKAYLKLCGVLTKSVRLLVFNHTTVSHMSSVFKKPRVEIIMDIKAKCWHPVNEQHHRTKRLQKLFDLNMVEKVLPDLKQDAPVRMGYKIYLKTITGKLSGQW